jgi:hypothetical protein
VLNSSHEPRENKGLGNIEKKEGFIALLKHKAFRKLPMIMEPPLDSREDDSDNLQTLMALVEICSRD